VRGAGPKSGGEKLKSGVRNFISLLILVKMPVRCNGRKNIVLYYFIILENTYYFLRKRDERMHDGLHTF
jgi:hypothetical protein